MLSPPNSEGTALVSVNADQLTAVLMSLPRSYRVVGSLDSLATGEVRLVLASTDVSGADLEMKIQITDVGSTRTVVLAP